MDEITPRCDFVFTGGEPLADLGSLQKMLDAIPNTHRIFVTHQLFPVRQNTLGRRERDRLHQRNRVDHLHQHLPPFGEVRGGSPRTR
ncbi:MAG: hypothetical protein ACLU38_01840 [Dysosmobacter sp.]